MDSAWNYEASCDDHDNLVTVGPDNSGSAVARPSRRPSHRRIVFRPVFHISQATAEKTHHEPPAAGSLRPGEAMEI